METQLSNFSLSSGWASVSRVRTRDGACRRVPCQRRVPLRLVLGLLVLGVTGSALSADYRSKASGNWEVAANWETWNGSGWVSTANAPAGAANENITIQSGHTITLSGAASLLGTLTNSGTLSISGTGILSIGSGGIMQNSGTVIGSATTLKFDSGGTYQHTFTTTAGTIPTATWNPGSTCAVIGYTTYAASPGGLGQSFYNFTWNCPDQKYDLSLGGNLTLITGDMSVVSTGAGVLQLKSTPVDATTLVRGAYHQSGGTVVVKSAGTGTQTLTVTGFSLTGGTFYMTWSGSGTLNCGGDFSVSGAGIFTRSGTGTAAVNFNGSQPQSFTNSGSMQGTINYTVKSGSTLLMGIYPLTGLGSFTLSSGARLGIGDPNGITSGTTASGNVRVTGTRAFDSGATYIYNGTAAQVTGNGLPTTLTGNVTNANSAGLSLTSNEIINTPGVFAVGSGALMTLGTTATISGTGAFILAGGGTLSSGHASGINGNITVSGQTLSPGANYIFNGTAAQAAGSLLPATVNSLTINNTAGAVTLARVTTVTAGVTLAGGAKLSLPSGTCTAASLSIAGVNQASGTWGNTGSGAAHIDSTHFAGSGVLSVASSGAANTITSVSTSLNPALPTETVTFTASVSSPDAGGAIPTGTVQFKSNGANQGNPVALLNGQASLTVPAASLGHGSKTIAVTYLPADGNFNTSTAILSPPQVVNTPPAASTLPLATTLTTPVSFLVAKLLELGASDADGDTVSLHSVTSPSAHGGIVVLSGSTITFTAQDGFSGSDSFTYTLDDGFATTDGTVTVEVRPGDFSSPITATLAPDGNSQIVASGIPDHPYQLQRSSDLNIPNPWTTIATTNALANGLIRFVDLDSTNHPTRYYRLAAP